MKPFTAQEAQPLIDSAQAAERYVQDIDQRLQAHAVNGFPGQLHITMKDVSPAVCHWIVDFYKAAGWAITIDADSEPTILIFSLPYTPPRGGPTDR